jgi:hypothetical protein
VGDIFRAQTRYLQGVDGATLAQAFEVIEAQEEQAGHVIRYRAQEMPANIPLVGEYSIVFSADEFDVVLYDVFVLEYGVPTSAITLTVEIQSGVLISASNTSIAALRPGNSWPAGSTITLINAGTISGRGGNGGRGGCNLTGETGGPGAAGGNGGIGINASDWPISIDNSTGIISGGGGGGGGGSAAGSVIGGGGGGGGWPYGAGGIGGARSQSTAPGWWGGNGASPTMAGIGGIAGAGAVDTVTAGNGGNGGGWAASGSAGSAAQFAGGSAGSPGDCINGNSNITWTATGTRYGTIS